MMGDCYCAAVVEALSRKVGVVVVVVVVVVVSQGGLFFDHCGMLERFLMRHYHLPGAGRNGPAEREAEAGGGGEADGAVDQLGQPGHAQESLYLLQWVEGGSARGGDNPMVGGGDGVFDGVVHDSCQVGRAEGCLCHRWCLLRIPR